MCEATGANIFLSRTERCTPDAGLFSQRHHRQSVIAIARARGVAVVERHIKPEELSDFSECFLTGSAAEVTPVSEIGAWRFKPVR